MAQLSERRKALLYLLLVAVSAGISAAGGLDLRRQVPAVAVFSSLILGTLLFWRFRLAFALVSALALFLLGLIDTKTFIEFASVDIVLFLVGMMILIGFLEERRFFEHLIDRIVGAVGGGPGRLMVVMMLLSYVFAALVDEVTS
ncbi:MAG: hypothetical protein HY558_03325, partial [Euryarchaeota archaeon]|nr:hypothetical protein [Euryarchaeota archaeon]